MRVLFTIAIALFLLGGTFAYTRFADSIEVRPQSYQVAFAQGTYSLEVSRTFTAVPDPDAGKESEFPSLGAESVRVLLKGQPVLVRSQEVPSSERLMVDSIPHVEQGLNEIFVFARRSATESAPLAAMQVKVLLQGRVIAESVFVNRSGSSIVYGTIVFEAGGEK